MSKPFTPEEVAKIVVNRGCTCDTQLVGQGLKCIFCKIRVAVELERSEADRRAERVTYQALFLGAIIGWVTGPVIGKIIVWLVLLPARLM